MSKIEQENKSRPEQFKEIAMELSEMYTKKNADYGNSFGETFKDVGIISAYTRMSDKFNRFKRAVISGGDKFNYEGIEDCLSDIGCYAIMTLIELREKNSDAVLTASEEARAKNIRKFLDQHKLTPPSWKPMDSWRDGMYKGIIGDLPTGGIKAGDMVGCMADERPSNERPSDGVTYGVCSCGETHTDSAPPTDKTKRHAQVIQIKSAEDLVDVLLNSIRVDVKQNAPKKGKKENV